MVRKNRYILFYLTLLFTFSGLMAQNLEIKGIVVGANDQEPLPGVNVLVKGTLLGAVTDLDGFFHLKLKDMSEARLEFTYVGYKTKEIRITENTENLLIKMEEDIFKASEIVVTGLASSVKRENLANSVATLSSEELLPTPTESMESALAGKFAGVNVSQNTGAPGGGISVNLRGVSTIEGGTQPLYVVDGVIINNAAIQSGIDLVTKAAGAGSSNPQGQPVNRVADINPDDIENIEVLKGASAAAIYGAKASNGVIIITTKKGRAGKPHINFNQRIGVSSLLKKIGTRKFTAATAEDQYGPDGLALYNANGGKFFDQEELMYGELGVLKQTNLSLTGGNNHTNYYLSGTFQDDGGIIKNTGYKRTAGNLNVNHKFTDRLDINVSTSIMRTVSDRGITGNDNTNTTFGFSLAFTPSFLDLRPKNGVYPDHPFNPSNPFHTRDVFKNTETTTRAISALNLKWNAWRTENQNLDLVLQTGFDTYAMENFVFSPPELQFEKNSDQPGSVLNGKTNSLNWNTYLSAVHLYGEGGYSFRTSAGLQFENLESDNVLTEAHSVVVTQKNVDQSGSVNVYENRVKRVDDGFYVQEEFNYEDMLFLTAGFRGDRSSAHGEVDKFFYYPKASASLRVSELGFWDSMKDIVSEAKLRLAYGETGNSPPANAKYNSLVTNNVDGNTGLLLASRQGNPEIRPERTAEIETGIDLSIMENMGTVEFTYYTQNITDLILIADVPPSSGFTEQYINAGSMNTQGIEFSLGLLPVDNDFFRWSSQVNFYKTWSEITKLDVDPFNKGGFATFLGTYRIQEGWSPTTIIGAEKNADGSFKPIGNETPDFEMGFNNNFKIGDFTLGFLIHWKNGGDVINLGKLITDLGGTTEDYDTGAAADRLSKLGSETKPYVEDGSYIKLREAHINYTLPQSVTESLFNGAVTSLRVGLSGRNLLMFTDYTGYDPEVSQFGNVAIGRHVDTLPYPSSRSVYFNLSLGL